MANVSWSFYRSRRRIDIRKLVNTRRVIDYPTYLSYCSEVQVLPASLHDFELEFGNVLSSVIAPSVLIQTQVEKESQTPPSPAAPGDGLEATIWLASVDDDVSTHSSSTSTLPKSAKKKKSKDGSLE